MRSISLKDNLLVIALILVACTLDGTLDVVFRHILAACCLKQSPETRVTGNIRTALFDGDGDFFSYFGECAGHVTPPFELPLFSELKCPSHK